MASCSKVSINPEMQTIHAEDCGQDVRGFGDLAHRAVLQQHVADLLVRVQGDPPSVFRLHRGNIEAVPLYLSFGLLDLCEVGGALWS